MIEPRAAAHRQPGSHYDIVLDKDSRDGERIVETGNVVVAVAICLDRRSSDPRVHSGGATNGDLAKPCAMAVVFENLAELVIVLLVGKGRSRGDQISATNETLIEDSGIHASRVERFHMERRSAFTIFNRHSRGGEKAVALVIAPEQSRPRDRATVAR